MDTNIKVNTGSNKKGFVIVWFVIFIPVALLFALIAIDFGYMYMTKGQLQNAADSAALAGAAILVNGNNSTYQTQARDEAEKFALANKAATVSIVIDKNNDVTFGYWNTSNTTFTPNGSPINAIQVRAARDISSASGQVPIVFGKYFGWDKMSAAATAIAALPARTTSDLVMCVDFCTSAAAAPFGRYTSAAFPPKVMDSGPTLPYSDKYAWTSYTSNISSASDITDLVCKQISVNQTACGQNIFTTMGTDKSILCNLEAQMYNPGYDAGNKDFVERETFSTTGWWAIVPVIPACPPGTQPYPNPVVKYAKIHILAICTQGCGSGSIKLPCTPYSAPAGVCTAIKNRYGLASVQNIIIIDKIECVDCPATSLWPGLRPILVK